MEDFAYALASSALLRSGAAPGADQAFEFGAVVGNGQHEIFLPWKGFQGRINGCLVEPSEQAIEIAKHYHPAWSFLKPPARKLIARNSHQVLGANLLDPVELVVCWTKDGSLDGAKPTSGGTGQALRIAADRGIAVLNLYHEGHRSILEEAIGSGGIPL